MGSMAHFRDVVAECELVDLGYSGPPLTWNNGRDAEDGIQERLDRFLVNEGWKQLFHVAARRHLAYWDSLRS